MRTCGLFTDNLFTWSRSFTLSAANQLFVHFLRELRPESTDELRITARLKSNNLAKFLSNFEDKRSRQKEKNQPCTNVSLTSKPVGSADTN